MDLTQDLKTRTRARCVAAEGAQVIVTQSRGEARRGARVHMRCLTSSVRLERRGEERLGGCARSRQPGRWGLRCAAAEMRLLASWLLRAKFERGSRCCDLQNPR